MYSTALVDAVATWRLTLVKIIITISADWIEDIYLIDLKTQQYVTITLRPLNASSDLEL